MPFGSPHWFYNLAAWLEEKADQAQHRANGYSLFDKKRQRWIRISNWLWSRAYEALLMGNLIDPYCDRDEVLEEIRRLDRKDPQDA